MAAEAGQALSSREGWWDLTNPPTHDPTDRFTALLAYILL
jgi:hypothetical protein